MTSSILPEKPNKSAFVFDWIDRVPPGRVFTAAEVVRDFYLRLPVGVKDGLMDGTVTKYFRNYNKEHGRKLVIPVGKKQQSRYMKLDPNELPLFAEEVMQITQQKGVRA